MTRHMTPTDKPYLNIEEYCMDKHIGPSEVRATSGANLGRPLF